MDGARPSPIASCRLLRHPRLAFATGLPPLHSPNPTQSARRARARSFHSPHRTRAASWCSRPLVDPRASGRVWIGGAVFPGGVGVKRDALPAPLPGGFGCLRVKATGPRSRAPVAITTQDSSSSQRRSVPFQHPVVTAPIHR